MMAADGTVRVDGGAAPGGGVGSFAPLGRVLQDPHWIPSALDRGGSGKILAE